MRSLGSQKEKTTAAKKLEKFRKELMQRENADPTRFKERHIQSLFPEFLQKFCPKLRIWSTFDDASIVHPQKPDVTITHCQYDANKYTALGFIELKQSKVAIDGHAKGEVLSAMGRLLENQIETKPVWGIATNSNDFFIAKLTRDDLWMNHSADFETVLYYLNNDITELAQPIVPVISTAVPTLPETFSVRGMLGKGRTSNVFSVKNTKFVDSYYVLKVALQGNDDVLRREAELMEKVVTPLNDLHFPKLFWSGMIHYRDEQCYALLMSPVTVEASVPFTRNDFVRLVQSLRRLHHTGHVHCDISYNNIGHYESLITGERIRTPMIRDFGFCRRSEPAIYSGTMATASNRILKLLANNPNEVITVCSRDDYESLWKSVYVLTTGFRPFVPESANDCCQKAAALLKWWEQHADESALARIDWKNDEMIGIMVSFLPAIRNFQTRTI